MEATALIIAVLSGLCFIPACFPHNYVLVKQPMTWTEAQSYCRLKYGDLATVFNEEEHSKVVDAAQEFYLGHVWIGLYDDINSWKWSLEKEDYYVGGEAEFRMWHSGEPNNAFGYEICTVIVADGVWNDVSCTQMNPFVCYNGNDETVGFSSFIFVNEAKTWSAAQNYCREHYTDLASVRNHPENEHIKNMITSKAWIGLYRDSWKWSDGSPTSFTRWNTNEPTDIRNPCVLLHEGQWEDAACDTQLYFVCRIVPTNQKVVRVKVTKKDSSVNLEDATEAILHQLSQALNDLNEDMKLIWRKQPDGKIFHKEAKDNGKKSEEIS
ncbi:hypothetical protein PAMA_008959 [Pampus argenteus]